MAEPRLSTGGSGSTRNINTLVRFDVPQKVETKTGSVSINPDTIETHTADKVGLEALDKVAAYNLSDPQAITPPPLLNLPSISVVHKKIDSKETSKTDVETHSKFKETLTSSAQKPEGQAKGKSIQIANEAAVLRKRLISENPNIQSKKEIDLEARKKILSFAQNTLKNSDDIVNDRSFKKGEFSSSTIYQNTAAGCIKAASSIERDTLLSDQLPLASKLKENAENLKSAAQQIDSKAIKVNEESQKILSDFARGKTFNAQTFIEQSDKCLKSLNNAISTDVRAQLRGNAHNLAEIGAGRKLEKGKVVEAFQVRANLLNKLGPPPLIGDPKLSDAFTLLNSSVFGVNIHDRSTKTIQTGNLNVDHRILRDANNNGSEITTVRARLNYHVRDNIDKTLSQNPKLVISGIEAALPKELKGKVSISTDEHLVYRNCIDRKNKTFAEGKIVPGTRLNSRKVKEATLVSKAGGMVLGKIWKLEIEGIGTLSISMVDLEMNAEEMRKKTEYTELVPIPEVSIGEGKGRAFVNTTVMQNVYLELDGNLSPEDKVKYSQLMLSMVGAGPVLEMNAEPDQAKKRILDSFSAFYPREAVILRLKESTFNMSAPELLETINKILDGPPLEAKPDYLPGENALKFAEFAPKYRAIARAGFEEAIKSDKQVITVDGRKINEISSQSKVIKEVCEKIGNPVYGLMIGVGGQSTEAYNVPRGLTQANITVAGLILKNGFMSTETRLNAGTVLDGDSPGPDLATGGGDTVFFRAITQKIAEKHERTAFSLGGTFQFIVGLEAVNEDPHVRASTEDKYGHNDPQNLTRCREGENPTLNQKSLTEVIASLDEGDKGNEIMIPGAVKPSHIKGILVRTEFEKNMMLKGLLKDGVIVDGKINGILANDFVHVNDKFQKKMWEI